MRIMQVNTYQHETRFISEKKPEIPVYIGESLKAGCIFGMSAP